MQIWSGQWAMPILHEEEGRFETIAFIIDCGLGVFLFALPQRLTQLALNCHTEIIVS